MTNANTKLLDAITARALDLQRLTAGQLGDARRFLGELEGDLVAQIAKFDPTGVAAPKRQAVRLEKMLKQVRETIRASYRGESKRLIGELRELADAEATFAASSVNKVIGVDMMTTGVTRNQLAALVSDVMIEGAPVSDWLSRQAGDTLQRFTDNMRLGIAQGETNAQLIRRVRGGKQNGEIVKGFMDTSRRNADTLVRSATQAVSQKARQATYDQNESLIKGLMWVSTIDLRTTVECSTRDGLTYTVETHEPIDHSLPWGGGPGNLHWGCRSTSAPVLKTFRDLGIDIDEVPKSTRSSLDGQIAQDTTFEGWLSRRSVLEQDANLGVGRAQLWRDGKIEFRDLVDGNGRELTLAELRGKVRAVPRAKAPKKSSQSKSVARIFAGKTRAEIDKVQPAFANSRVDRLELIRAAGNLSGGLKEGQGSFHRGSDMSMQMQKGYDKASYDRVMRHEYGHHLDARMEYSMMEDIGATKSDLIKAMGPSRLAKPDLKNDAIMLEKSISKDTRNAWRGKSGKPTKGFAESIDAARVDLLSKYSKAGSSSGQLRSINSDMEARGLDYDGVKDMFRHMFTDTKDAATIRQEAARFISSFDFRDHATLVYDARFEMDHKSALAGLSDSLGAATNQRIGYSFGHKITYYAKFRKYDRQDRNVTDPFGGGTRTPTGGAYAYGTGNTAQLWANWFEAYTSGSDTQYSVFKKFFGNTSLRFENIAREFAENGTIKIQQ